MNKKYLLAVAVAAALSLSGFHAVRAADDAAESSGTPQVFLDKNPRIVAYQLKRLSNAQLVAVERRRGRESRRSIARRRSRRWRRWAIPIR